MIKFRFEEKPDFIRTRDMPAVHNTSSAFAVLMSLHVNELHKYQLIYMEFIESIRTGKSWM